MMIGEPHHHRNPTILVPPWSHVDDSTVDLSFPYSVGGISVNPNGNDDDCSPLDALKALQHYLPAYDVDFDSDESGRELDFPLDAYSCDQFRMFEFKVRKCTRGRSHDWTDCPFAHPGEKARRRDPRKYHYSGTSCPDYRKGNCGKGDACEFSHGVFESWLHPARYRTQPCKDGPNCRRRVCFFAHTPDQLRVLSPSPSPSPSHSFDGSPLRLAMEGLSARGFDFESAVSPLSESPPPMTNSVSRSPGLSSINEVVASMRQLQLNKVKSMPPSWGLQMGSPGFGSTSISISRPAFCSLPSTPSGVVTRYGLGPFDAWDKGGCDEPLMERVESGKDLRAKMFEKLCRENPLEDEPGRVDEPSGSVVG